MLVSFFLKNKDYPQPGADIFEPSLIAVLVSRCMPGQRPARVSLSGLAVKRALHSYTIGSLVSLFYHDFISGIECTK